MFALSESERPAISNLRLIEQAFFHMKQTILSQLERESQREQRFAICQEKWKAQFEQLHNRIEILEAHLAPWIIDRDPVPRLAVVGNAEEAT